MVRVQSVGTLPAGLTRASLRSLVALACRRAGARGNLAVAIRVADDRTVRELNRVHRGKDKVTDVLSFSYADGLPPAMRGTKEGRRELGDIVIALPQVRRQAKAIGRPVKAEFALMVVHGVLHLLGHDHESVAQEQAMFSLQHDILIRAGIL
jgi:probable rRNA maturation factor